MTPEQIERLEARIFETIHVHTKSLTAMKLLEADNARLRALVKAQEFGSKHEAGPFCPWCSAGGDGGHTHDDCPAFTPSGDVR